MWYRLKVCRKGSSDMDGGGSRQSAREITGSYEIGSKTSSQRQIIDFWRYAQESNGIRVDADGTLHLRQATLNRAIELGRTLANRIEMRDPDALAAYRGIRRMLNGKYYLSAADRRNIPDFGAYNRSENMVRVTTDRRATSLDSAYQQLRTAYPQYFGSRATHPADQLQQINTVMRNLRDARFALSASDRQDMARELTNELVNGYIRNRRRRSA